MGDMMLTPARLDGSVRVPPSKSLAHRAVLCAALAGGGESILRNVAYSDDIRATLQGAVALGASARQEGDTLRVQGISSPEKTARIDCNESGSTLRFLLPIALALGVSTHFVGRGNLGKRPLTAYFDMMREQGISFETGEGDLLDLRVRGKLRPGRFVLPGNVSSQYITGLLLALPLLDAPSEIAIEGPLESKGYLDLTLQTMAHFGVRVEHEDYRLFKIAPGEYRPADTTVEGDFSQAAFFLSAGVLQSLRRDGGRVAVEGLSPLSAQGDRAVCEILETMGARVEWDEQGHLCCTAAELRGCVIDAAPCPDIIPILSAVACACRGETRILNAGRLRIKECDRLAAVARELTALGAEIQEGEDFLLIAGRKEKKWPFSGDTTVWSHADHRMAMTLSVAATVCEKPFVLKDYPCVSKSYPDFYEDYRSLGGVCRELDLGQ